VTRYNNGVGHSRGPSQLFPLIVTRVQCDPLPDYLPQMDDFALILTQWIAVVRNSEQLAEREGFEPPVRLHVLRISSAARSTTLPPLRGGKARRLPLVVRLVTTRAALC
jgi:hypothetical protein